MVSELRLSANSVEFHKQLATMNEGSVRNNQTQLVKIAPIFIAYLNGLGYATMVLIRNITESCRKILVKVELFYLSIV